MNISFTRIYPKVSSLLNNKPEIEFIILIVISTLLLFSIVLIPYVSVTYELDRLYSLAAVPLSVPFIIGARISFILIYKIKAYVIFNRTNSSSLIDACIPKSIPFFIMLFVLIPYLLSITGVTYQMCGYPFSITLNSKGTEFDDLYVYDQEVSSSKWLGAHYLQNTVFVVDPAGSRPLRSHGLIPANEIDYVSFSAQKLINSYLYLRHYNVVSGKLLIDKMVKEMSNYKDVFRYKNKIYINSGSEIWV
jgi:uncharacterized membrane protein